MEHGFQQCSHGLISAKLRRCRMPKYVENGGSENVEMEAATPAETEMEGNAVTCTSPAVFGKARMNSFLVSLDRMVLLP
jgi:hypothetical protein